MDSPLRRHGNHGSTVQEAIQPHHENKMQGPMASLLVIYVRIELQKHDVLGSSICVSEFLVRNGQGTRRRKRKEILTFTAIEAVERGRAGLARPSCRVTQRPRRAGRSIPKMLCRHRRLSRVTNSIGHQDTAASGAAILLIYIMREADQKNAATEIQCSVSHHDRPTTMCQIASCWRQTTRRLGCHAFSVKLPSSMEM